MERWAGRVAVVTGASSGIGASITEELVKKGLKVAGLARRVERVEELAKSLKSEKGSLKALKCDVSKEEEVKETFQWVKNNLGGIDILVNNAGVAFACSPSDGLTEQWKTILDLNVLGLSICTREALNVMKEKGVDDGHIVHINSILGHIPPPNERIAMYTASKHAVTALTEGLRRDLVNKKSKIRITSVSPGLVRTEMPTKELLENMTSLNPVDIANAVLYALGTPPHVQESAFEQDKNGSLGWTSGHRNWSKWRNRSLNCTGTGEERSKSGWSRKKSRKHSDGPVESWKLILELNVLALSICTKEAIQSMKDSGVDGHIIHINSTLGHVIPPGDLGLSMYSASKHAVTALTEGLRKELVKNNSKIRITSVSPGLVKTDFFTSSGTTPGTPEMMYSTNPHLHPKDVADCVVFALSLSPHAQVSELTLQAVGERF